MPVGNDIVDLRAADTQPGATHERFLLRVCCSEEIARIAAATDPNTMMWVYWAAKESAYKALRKLDPSLRFLPRQFVVQLRPVAGDAILSGNVDAAGLTATVDVHRRVQYVHAVARAKAHGSGGRILCGVRHLPARETPMFLSTAARRLLVDHLAAYLHCPRTDLAVTPPTGRGVPPRLTLRGAPAAIDVSLSHHGRVAAFAAAVLPDTDSDHVESARGAHD